MNLTLLSWLVALSTAIDVAVVAGIGLRGDRDRAIGLPRALIALLAGVAVFLAKLPVLWGLGLSPFGLIRVLYAALVVGLPAIALLILGISRLRSRAVAGPVVTLCFVALLGVPVGVYATWIEPYRLQLEEVEVVLPAERSGSGPIRVGVLADLQTDDVGDHEWRAVRLLMDQRPDIILLPGDLFHGYPVTFRRNFSRLRDLLGELDAPGGVFLVKGDTDHSARIPPLIAGTSIRYLRGEVATVSVGDRTVCIAGVTTPRAFASAREFGSVFAAEPGESDVRILMGHHPDVALGLQSGERLDLVVAGHTHGGQVVLPFFGPPMTLTSVPRRVAAGGLHDLDGVRIYVSRGVGAERTQAPQIRFLCPPEVAIITLR